MPMGASVGVMSGSGRPIGARGRLFDGGGGGWLRREPSDLAVCASAMLGRTTRSAASRRRMVHLIPLYARMPGGKLIGTLAPRRKLDSREAR